MTTSGFDGMRPLTVGEVVAIVASDPGHIPIYYYGKLKGPQFEPALRKALIRGVIRKESNPSVAGGFVLTTSIKP